MTDILSHPFFEGIKIADLFTHKIPSPAKFGPKNLEMTSFNSFIELNTSLSPSEVALSTENQELFKDFSIQKKEHT